MTNFLAKNQFWQTFLNSLNCMRLIFYLDCEEYIFDRISKNTYLNRMGLVSSWSRSKNLSYELKLIFSSFWRNFIDRAWIWGCPAHDEKIQQYEKPWITSGCETKFIAYPFAHSSFQKDFTSCNFQAIFLWLFASARACNWWIFKRS